VLSFVSILLHSGTFHHLDRLSLMTKFLTQCRNGTAGHKSAGMADFFWNNHRLGSVSSAVGCILQIDADFYIGPPPELRPALKILKLTFIFNRPGVGRLKTFEHAMQTQ
jgi:hypothetical protein